MNADLMRLPKLENSIPAQVIASQEELHWHGAITALAATGILIDEDCPLGGATAAGDAVSNVLRRLYGRDDIEDAIWSVLVHVSTDWSQYWYGDEGGALEVLGITEDSDDTDLPRLFVAFLPTDAEVCRSLSAVLLKAYAADPEIAFVILACLETLSGDNFRFFTPSQCFDHCREYKWEGEDDESFVVEQYGSGDDLVTLNDWQSVPEWARVVSFQIFKDSDLAGLAATYPEWGDVLSLIAQIRELLDRYQDAVESAGVCDFYGPQPSVTLCWQPMDVCNRVVDDMRYFFADQGSNAEMHTLFCVDLSDPVPGIELIGSALLLGRYVDRLARLVSEPCH